MRVGTVLILAGLLILMGGVVARAQFVPEKPYLVVSPHLTQAQIFINAFDNAGIENENTVWQYTGSLGISMIIDENENVGYLMLIAGGENILRQENHIWIWANGVTIKGNIASITNIGTRSWEIILSPIQIDNNTYENGAILFRIAYGINGFKFYLKVCGAECMILGTDMLYANAEYVKLYGTD